MKTNDFAMKKSTFPIHLNILGLLGICIALGCAFYQQLVHSDLPCPLCLLQRIGMMMIGFGFLFNIRFGISNTHYSIGLIGCIVTGLIATRQVFLHILPGDPGYGLTFLGLHLYSWSLIASVIAIIFIAILMLFNSQGLAMYSGLGKLLIWIFALIIAANLVSVILECGAGQCQADPTYYELLGK